MSRLIRKANALQHLELNATHIHTEQQALRFEVDDVKDALKRSYTAYAMLRDDVERFKSVVREQDVVLRGLRDEVFNMRREFAASTRPPAIEKRAELANMRKGKNADEKKLMYA